MCEFHGSNCNDLGDIWWTDKCIYFSSIDYSTVELTHIKKNITYITSHKKAAPCKVMRTQGFTKFTFERIQTSYGS